MEQNNSRFLPFDFNKFLRSNNIWHLDLAVLLKYSFSGIVTMARRGTIKKALIPDIENTYPNVKEFLL